MSNDMPHMISNDKSHTPKGHDKVPPPGGSGTIGSGNPVQESNYKVVSVDLPHSASSPAFGSGTTLRIADINDKGVLAGTYTYPAVNVSGGPGGVIGNPYGVGFSLTPDAVIKQVPPDQHSTVTGINNSGVLVGEMGHYENTARGFIANTDGSVTEINSPGDTSITRATGIANDGTVIGNAFPRSGNSALVTNFSLHEGEWTDLSIPGYSRVFVSGISGDGHYIVGNTGQEINGATRDANESFVSAGGISTALRVPNAAYTSASDVSNSGVVVGTFVDSDLHTHGFLYDTKSETYSRFDVPEKPGQDLNTILSGINEKGELVGSYSAFDRSVDPNTYGFVASSTYLDYGSYETNIGTASVIALAG